MTRGAFAEATALQPLGEGEFAVVLDERFSIGGAPNGGYLLAVLSAAAADALASGDVAHPECLAASAAYARAPRLGEATVAVAVDRRGTTVSQVHAALRQGGRTLVRALLTMGRRRGRSVVRGGPPPAGFAALDACERARADGAPGRRLSILDVADVRLDPATPLRPDGPATPQVRGWLRLDEDRELDAEAVLFLLDVLPPATAPLGSTGWAPTIQLAASLRAAPSSRWLRGRQRARWVEGGLVQQHCELWDHDGELVAEATQLAMVRFR